MAWMLKLAGDGNNLIFTEHSPWARHSLANQRSQHDHQEANAATVIEEINRGTEDKQLAQSCRLSQWLTLLDEESWVRGNCCWAGSARCAGP